MSCGISNVLTIAAEQHRRESRDNSASPLPTTVQTQQPQSTQPHVTTANVEQAETATPSGDDTGIYLKQLHLSSVKEVAATCIF